MAKTKLAPRPRRKKPAHVARSKPKTSQTHSEATTTAAEKPAGAGPFLFSPTFKFESKAGLEAARQAWARAQKLKVDMTSVARVFEAIQTGGDPKTGRPWPDPVWHFLTPSIVNELLDEIEGRLADARDYLAESGNAQHWQDRVVSALAEIQDAFVSTGDMRGRITPEKESEVRS